MAQVGRDAAAQLLPGGCGDGVLGAEQGAPERSRRKEGERSVLCCAHDQLPQALD